MAITTNTTSPFDIDRYVTARGTTQVPRERELPRVIGLDRAQHQIAPAANWLIQVRSQIAA